MTRDLKLEIVVTRSHIPSADFTETLDKLLEIEAFANAMGLIVHFAVAITNSRLEKADVN